MAENLASRNMIMDKLVKDGYFKFAGFIQNEVRGTALVLFKSVARYMELPSDEATKITKAYAEQLAEKKYTGWLRQACETLDLPWQDQWEQMEPKMDFCYRYAKIPYNSSIAASGVIMTDDDVQLPIRDGVVRYNSVDLEEMGYIKFDILTVSTLDDIQYFYGLDYDWNDVDDPKVWDSICAGDTDFCFQFSGNGMKRLITGSQPRNIESLAEINALWRPGPIEAGLVEKYIAIKKGEDPQLTEEEQIVSDVLKSVFGEQHCGLAIFQEDVMRLCQECAGFTLTEADDVRKAMGKKKEDVLAKWEERFVSGWNRNGDPHKVWESLKGFAHYAFNKSHSVAYAIIGYATQRIWVEHRDKFLEYCLNESTKENYTLAIEKCKQLGMRFDYPGIQDLGNRKFWIEDGHTLHVPIECEREYSGYVDMLFDPENTQVASLVYKGVCDGLTKDRYALAVMITSLLSKASKQAHYMEPQGVKFNRLDQILDGLKLCGGVADWERKTDGEIHVLVTRANGRKPDLVVFHPDSSDTVRAGRVKYDLKMFGTVRNGVLSDLPYVNYHALESACENVRERMLARGKDERSVYNELRNMVEDHMRRNYPTDKNRVFPDVFAIVRDVFVYSNSTKLVVEFNDRQDILYVKGSLADKAMRLKKNALVKFELEYSPYVARRNMKYVHDFDVLNMEEVND